MIAVIDMGSIIYRAAVTNTTDDLGVSKEYLVERINDILIKTKADKYILCVDSDKNWKKLSMKSYKADRGRKFIKFLKEIKIWVISELGGTVVNGLEADDLCYIAVSEFGPQNTITCHIDSDLNCISGKHFNFDWEIDKALYTVTKFESWNNFRKNIICGSHNNNKGLKGFGKVTFDKIKDCDSSLGLLLNLFIDGVSKEEVEGIRTIQGLGIVKGVIEYNKSFLQALILRDKREALDMLKRVGINIEDFNFNILEGELSYGRSVKF